VVIEATSKHSATVIFLHGLGDSGAGWRPVASVMAKQLPHVKWVLPNAPTRPISLFRGMPAPAWFDIRSISMDPALEDEKGITAAVKTIETLIDQEIAAGIPSSRIVLGGFSQGGATSLFTGASTQKGLAGVVCLSGWLLLSHRLKQLASETSKQTAFFLAHGEDDEIVPHEYGVESHKVFSKTLDIPYRSLDAAGPGIVFKSYSDMGHSSDPREIQDLTRWISGRIP